jgi:hypothetical protein
METGNDPVVASARVVAVVNYRGCYVSMLRRAVCAKSEQGGGLTWQVLFFLPRVAEFPRPKSHMTWIFSPFCGISQKGIIVGGDS